MNKVLTNISQDLSALEKQTARRNIGAEDESNRVTSIDENSTDTQYPSAKCVFNALQNVGGGGYKDGGQLIDGDFIKVENNTLSSYDNVSRDPVNFYIEVKDGEVLNGIVELTTAVNATINVYVVKNGFYYLLGNIGGNTVNAGDDYKVNITGDSYAIEQVSAQPTPEYADIDGNPYGLITVGSLLWTTSNLKKGFTHNGMYYHPKDGLLNYNFNGWRLPTEDEFLALLDAFPYQDLKGSDIWYPGTGGTNNSGFNVGAYGVWLTDSQFISSYHESGLFPYTMIISGIKTLNSISFNDSGASFGQGFYDVWQMTVRLVKQV